MYNPCVEKQISECHRKKQQARNGRHRSGAGEAGAEKHEVHDETPVGAIGPEEIAVFIDDEKFRGDFCREPPLPFRHDRLGGADDSYRGVIARFQFSEQAQAAGRLGVIGYARYGSAQTIGRSGEAGDEIDLNSIAVDLIELGDQGVEQMARAAFDQQDTGQRWDVAAEEVAHNVRMAR